MTSSAMQRYAAEIHRLQEDEPYVALSLLAEHLDVSAQAVSRMVRRMRDAGLVEHAPYRGVRLTEAGVAAGLPAIRRHRLAEVFLERVLGYDWAEVHDLAAVFENGMDDELEARIDEVLGYPKHCPHGDPIPTPDGRIPALADVCLTRLESGTPGTITRVRTHSPDKLRYLQEIGLKPGTSFDLQSCGPFDGPLRLFYDNRDIVLGYQLASSLWAEPESEMESEPGAGPRDGVGEQVAGLEAAGVTGR